MDVNYWQQQLDEQTRLLENTAARLHGESEQEVAAMRQRQQELRKQFQAATDQGASFVEALGQAFQHAVVELGRDLATLRQRSSLTDESNKKAR